MRRNPPSLTHDRAKFDANDVKPIENLLDFTSILSSSMYSTQLVAIIIRYSATGTFTRKDGKWRQEPVSGL